MQIREALKIANEKLSESSTPQLDSRLLLCKVLECTHEKLLLNYNQELSKGLQDQFFQLIARRVAMEPVAYILESQEFYGLKFFVNKDVLIPRPDTEILVDALIKECFNKEEVNILELGTGSGAISVALSANLPLAKITATDISEKALLVARKNSDSNKTSEKITFRQSDWYKNIKSFQYDYIISNPPYIDCSEQGQMSVETKQFEPELALYAEDDGLASYKIIIASASQYLKPKGKIFLEIGYRQKDAIFFILGQHNFINITSLQDLSGHDRVVIAEHSAK
jgi:release factor glutamine methyltransferase